MRPRRHSGSHSAERNPKNPDLTLAIESAQLRDALASASKTRAWFKRIDHGIWVGRVIGAHLHAIQGTHLGSLTGKLRDWADGNV